MELPKSLAELARETFVDGCINETLAALEAAERLEQATDPTVRRVLQRVVEEETRHAELAWRTVAWALREGGSEVRAQIIASIRAPRALDDRARVAMRKVIEPCAAALVLTV